MDREWDEILGIWRKGVIRWGCDVVGDEMG